MPLHVLKTGKYTCSMCKRLRKLQETTLRDFGSTFRVGADVDLCDFHGNGRTSYRTKQKFSRAFLLTSINHVKFIPFHWHIELLTLTRPGSLCCFTYRKRAWLAQLSEGPVSNHRVLRAQNCTFSAAVCTLGQGKSDAYTGKEAKYLMHSATSLLVLLAGSKLRQTWLLVLRSL